jgi:hypothetical protein
VGNGGQTKLIGSCYVTGKQPNSIINLHILSYMYCISDLLILIKRQLHYNGQFYLLIDALAPTREIPLARLLSLLLASQALSGHFSHHPECLNSMYIIWFGKSYCQVQAWLQWHRSINTTTSLHDIIATDNVYWTLPYL